MRVFRAVSGVPSERDEPSAEPDVVVLQEREQRRTPLLVVLLGAVAAMAAVALLGWLAISAVRGDDSGGPDDVASGGVRADAAQTLVVGEDGVDLLALSTGSLLPHVGQDVRGTVAVQSVVADEGFWVGDDDARVYVHLSAAARGGGGESEASIDADDVVSLTGEVAAVADAQEDVAGVTVDEGRDELLAQGALVRADTYAVDE